MKASLKQEWINALRSGKYEQGRNYLKTKNRHGVIKYCCLGVLCEIANLKFTWDDRLKKFLINDYFQILPYEIIENLQITKNDVDKLINLNDVYRCSFTEISYWIEKNISSDEDDFVDLTRCSESEKLLGHKGQE